MELKNFTDLNEVEKILVFGWRNHLKIAPLMKTQTIPLKEHLRFLESLKCDSTKQYFLALRGDEILGVLCFTGIERGISCEFGIYQNPDLKGNGKALMEAMLRYAKENLKVLTINACAINENTKAITLYQNFGFQLTHKDTQMSYFYFNVAGGGKISSLQSYFQGYFIPLNNTSYNPARFHTSCLQNTQNTQKHGITNTFKSKDSTTKPIFKPVCVKVA